MAGTGALGDRRLRRWGGLWRTTAVVVVAGGCGLVATVVAAALDLELTGFLAPPDPDPAVVAGCVAGLAACAGVPLLLARLLLPRGRRWPAGAAFVGSGLLGVLLLLAVLGAS